MQINTFLRRFFGLLIFTNSLLDSGFAATGLSGVTLYPEPLRGCVRGTCAEGVYVSDVALNSPAYRLGLRPKDLITKVSGRPALEVKSVLEALDPMQQNMSLAVLRNGEWLMLQSEGVATADNAAITKADLAAVPLASDRERGVSAPPEGSAAEMKVSRRGEEMNHAPMPKAPPDSRDLHQGIRLGVKECGPGDIRIGGTRLPPLYVTENINVSYRVICPGALPISGKIYGYRGDGFSCSESDMRPIDLSCKTMDARVVVEFVSTEP